MCQEPERQPFPKIALFVPVVILLEPAVFIGKRYEKKGAVECKPSREKLAHTKCSFCGGLMSAPLAFYPACDRSQTLPSPISEEPSCSTFND